MFPYYDTPPPPRPYLLLPSKCHKLSAVLLLFDFVANHAHFILKSVGKYLIFSMEGVWGGEGGYVPLRGKFHQNDLFIFEPFPKRGR